MEFPNHTPVFKIGFTGTRNGMTEYQLSYFKGLLVSFNDLYSDIEFHEGDCIGADEQAAEVAYKLKFKVIAHPPVDDKYQAFADCSVLLSAKPYLERNKDIVNCSDILIACPRTMFKPSNLRGEGTWWTITYAEKINKKVQIIKPYK